MDFAQLWRQVLVNDWDNCSTLSVKHLVITEDSVKTFKIKLDNSGVSVAKDQEFSAVVNELELRNPIGTPRVFEVKIGFLVQYIPDSQAPITRGRCDQFCIIVNRQCRDLAFVCIKRNAGPPGFFRS